MESPAEAPLQLLRPLYGPDAGDAAKTQNHAVQVPDIFGFNHKLDDGFAVLVVAHLHTADIGVVIGDCSGQFLQHACAVVAEYGDLDRVALRLARGLVAYARPFHGNAAVALIEQVLHIRATARMNGNALAARDKKPHLPSPPQG